MLNNQMSLFLHESPQYCFNGIREKRRKAKRPGLRDVKIITYITCSLTDSLIQYNPNKAIRKQTFQSASFFRGGSFTAITNAAPSPTPPRPHKKKLHNEPKEIVASLVDQNPHGRWQRYECCVQVQSFCEMLLCSKQESREFTHVQHVTCTRCITAGEVPMEATRFW